MPPEPRAQAEGCGPHPARFRQHALRRRGALPAARKEEHGAAESPAGHSPAVNRGLGLAGLDQAVERGHRHFVVVAQRAMRRREQRAERGRVTLLERAHGGEDALVLARHVPHARQQVLRQSRLPAGGQVAQRGNAQRRARRRAFLAPPVVGTAGVAVTHARVDHDQLDARGQRQLAHGERARIDEQCAVLVGQHGGQRIHDADAGAGEAVLGLLRQPRHLDRLELEAVEIAQRAQEGDRQRRARGQARAHGDVRAHFEVAAGPDARPERRGQALHVVDPAARRRLRAELVLAGSRLGGIHVHDAVVARAPLDPHRVGNRGRQDEALVVVRVLADQVHAAVGDAGHDAGARRAHRASSSIGTARSSAARVSGSESLVNAPAPSSAPATYLSRSGARSGG